MNRVEETLRRLIDLAAERTQRPVEDTRHDRLLEFARLAQTWGRKIDLFSTTDDVRLTEILFVDALELADPEIVPTGASLIDVGAGGGAPTIPLLLLREDLRASLAESRSRRCAFLRTAIGTLKLTDRAVVAQTTVANDPQPLPGAPFDVALSRATLPPESWLRLGRKLAPRVVVFTASQPPPKESSVAERRYRIPTTGAERTLTVY